MHKRIASILLALIMALTALTACGGGSGSGSDVTAAGSDAAETVTEPVVTADPTRIPPDFKVNFDGQVYKIFNGYSKETKYISRDIYPEEITGESLNDSMIERCTATEEKLGCVIEVTDGDLGRIKSNVAAGDDFAHVTYVDLSNIMNMVVSGYCLDFYDMPNIELSKVWWDRNAEAKLSFQGQLYYTFNDSIFTHMDNCRAVYFNKQLVNDLGLGNLYEKVDDGTWTMAEMFRCGVAAVADLDGNGVWNNQDRYGTLMWGVTGIGEMLLTGCDSEIMLQGDDGNPYFYCFTERFAEIYEKVLDFIKKDHNYFTSDVNAFMNGKSLFFGAALNSTGPMRAMETDFGILPAPKYTEDQEKYWNVSPNAHAMMLPVTITDTEFAGTVMEELAYQSSISLLPAYFDIMLKGKSARDEESEAMLDLIHDSISYIIKIIGVKFSDSIYSEMSKGNYAISSFLASKQESVELELQNVLDQFAGG